MRLPIRLELFVAQVERRETLGADEVRERAAPGVLHERADLTEPRIADVAPDQLFVRALDQQTRRLWRDLAAR
jgi:hypothetical protein